MNEMNEINDWQLSQWISQLLAGELDESQQAKLQAALQQSPASRRFAQWSSRIQEAAAATHRLESLPPDEVSVAPDECLSELSKARLQRSVLTALKQWNARSDSQQQLRVAQAPSVYRSRPAGAEEVKGSEETPETEQFSQPEQNSDELLRGGRELRGRLIAHFGGMLQTLHWLVDLVSLANLQNTSGARAPLRPASSPAPAADRSPIGLEQLASVVVSMLRVQSSLCAVSVARYHTHNFDELLRAQRGPRDLSDLSLLPADRLRHGAANPFHQSVFEAPSQTPIFDLDHSVAGWQRIVLGLPLSASEARPEKSTASSNAKSLATAIVPSDHRWGLAIVEADVDRLVNAQIVAAGVDAMVALIDRHDRVLFSTPARSDARSIAVAELIKGQLLPVRDLARTGEIHLPDSGLWATLLTCPAPLDNLRLVLSPMN